MKNWFNVAGKDKDKNDATDSIILNCSSIIDKRHGSRQVPVKINSISPLDSSDQSCNNVPSILR